MEVCVICFDASTTVLREGVHPDAPHTAALHQYCVETESSSTFESRYTERAHLAVADTVPTEMGAALVGASGPFGDVDFAMSAPTAAPAPDQATQPQSHGVPTKELLPCYMRFALLTRCALLGVGCCSSE